eukprot:94709_1
MSYGKDQYDFWKKYKKNGNSNTTKYVARLACDYYEQPKPGTGLSKKYISSQATHDYYTNRMHDRAVAEQQRANVASSWSLGSAIAPDSTDHGGRRVGNTNIIVPSHW